MISKELETEIGNQVKQAAVEHLYAKTAEEALSHFTDDIIAVSNNKIFGSPEILANDVREYYNNLKEVNYAEWDEIHIKVINKNAATFTARFLYSFTNTNNEKINLEGIWTALFVRDRGIWKIRLRHESFTQS